MFQQCDTTSLVPESSSRDPYLMNQLAEPLYDMKWYPWMNAYQPETCVYACSQPDHPVHLYDASTGTIRASYVIQNHQEQILGAYSLCFSVDGQYLFAGMEGWLTKFDLTRPGRDPLMTIKTQVTRKDRKGQRGIFSAMQISPAYNVLAIGSYGRTIGLYDVRSGESHYLIRGISAPTHLTFDGSGRYLISSHREDGSVHCFDLRTFKTVWNVDRLHATNMRTSVQVLENNQQVILSACGVGGNQVWLTDLATGTDQCVMTEQGDLIHCCQVRGEWGITTSGQRPIRSSICDSTHENGFNSLPFEQDYAFRLWQFPGEYKPIEEASPFTSEQLD